MKRVRESAGPSDTAGAAQEDSPRGHIRIGIGGWTFEPWRGSFYPKGLARNRELEYASRKLTSIEINTTYYGLQKPERFAKWYEDTPEGFVFALKGPRFTTNRRVLADAGESIERFFDSGVMLLKEKLGPINWQFMPAKKFDPVDFRAFLELLPRSLDGRALRHAIEVRHDSFATPEAIVLARQHGVAVVLAADSKYPQINDVTASFVYARIMGARESEPNGYTAADLDRWAIRARDWASGKCADLPTIQSSDVACDCRDVFLYFISGCKPRNPLAGIELIRRLTGE